MRAIVTGLYQLGILMSIGSDALWNSSVIRPTIILNANSCGGLKIENNAVCRTIVLENGHTVTVTGQNICPTYPSI